MWFQRLYFPCIRYLFGASKKWFINFNCVLLTIKLVEGLEVMVSWPWEMPLPIQLTFFGGKRLTQHCETIILHKDRKEMCPLYHFLAQHLTTSDNPISLNMKFNILARSWKFKILQKIRQTTKYKLQKTWGGKMSIFPYFYSLLMNMSKKAHSNSSNKNIKTSFRNISEQFLSLFG